MVRFVVERQAALVRDRLLMSFIVLTVYSGGSNMPQPLSHSYQMWTIGMAALDKMEAAQLHVLFHGTTSSKATCEAC